ncbi:MAG: glycosyltransferase [Verrucomicrobiales bacterium]
MKILMTNHRLLSAGGTEWFIVETARALQSRGHEVAVFTPVGGEMAERLLAAAIPAVALPRDCPFVPEIIHGQHHLETMAALAAWPGVPAIYFIHGATPWEEHPPAHPRISRYLAPAPRFSNWISRECGVPETMVEAVRNFFDPDRFPVVRAQPLAGKRALVFHNTMESEGEAVAALQAGCASAGYSLDRAGVAFGNILAEPGRVLPEYDVVFAAGRSAIEAMACGCGVIPVMARQSAERIHPGNYAEMVDRNFTAEINAPPMDAANIAGHLRAFRAEEIAEISRRIRAEATLDATTEHLLDVYRTALSSPIEHTPEAEAKAVSSYLARLSARVKDADAARDRLIDEKDRANLRSAKWKKRAETLARSLRSFETEATRAPFWIRRWWRRVRRGGNTQRWASSLGEIESRTMNELVRCG